MSSLSEIHLLIANDIMMLKNYGAKVSGIEKGDLNFYEDKLPSSSELLETLKRIARLQGVWREENEKS
jgi:hypothetical protein